MPCEVLPSAGVPVRMSIREVDDWQVIEDVEPAGEGPVIYHQAGEERMRTSNDRKLKLTFTAD